MRSSAATSLTRRSSTSLDFRMSENDSPIREGTSNNRCPSSWARVNRGRDFTSRLLIRMTARPSQKRHQPSHPCITEYRTSTRRCSASFSGPSGNASSRFPVLPRPRSSWRLAQRTNAEHVVQVRKQRLLGRHVSEPRGPDSETCTRNFGCRARSWTMCLSRSESTVTSRNWSISSRNRDFGRSTPPVTGEKSSSL